MSYEEDTLTAQQEQFCQNYATDIKGNGTQAALSAGYGNTPESASVQASRLLKNVKIKKRIKEIRSDTLASSGFSQEHIRRLIIERLVGIVGTNVTDIIDVIPEDDPRREELLRQIAQQNGGQRSLDFGEVLLRPSSALTDEQAGAIKSIKRNGESLSVEMQDSIQAAKLLAELYDLKKADGEVAITFTPSGIIEEVEKRNGDAASEGSSH